MPRTVVIAFSLGTLLSAMQAVVMGIYMHDALIDGVDICSGTLELFYYVPISAIAFLIGLPTGLWACYKGFKESRRHWPVCILAVVLNILPLYLPGYVMNYIDRARHMDYAKDCR